MEPAVPRSDSSDALERLLDDLLAAETAAAVVETGARWLAQMSGAASAAIFLFEEGRPTFEGWHPITVAETSQAVPLRTLAREAMGLPLGPEAGEPIHRLPGLARLPLVFHGRTMGYALLLPGDLPPECGPAVQRAVRFIACRAGAEAEIAASQGAHARYQRWFKTLDEQLRVLDRERQKFAAIVHSSDAPVFVTDRARVIRWTNSVMAESKGESGGAWIGLSCRDACRHFTDGPDEDPCRSCPVSQVLERNSVVHREYRDMRDGRDRSLYLSALPIRDPSGTPEEVMVTLQDLSDLEILRTSEARYRLLFERSSRGIAMIDPATHAILLANSTASRMTGHPPEKLHALTLEDLHSPEEWRKLEPVYTVGLTGGVLDPMDCEITRRDGESRQAVVSGTRAELDGRQVLMLEFRDVTETRRVEEALRQTEARLRVVVAASPIILFAIDRHGVITLAEGKGLERLSQEGGLAGISVFDLYQDYPDALADVRRALAGEEFTTILDVRGLAFETSFSPLKSPDGENLGVIGVATDVTERRRLSEQLRQAQRMEAIGRLAGGVAHDFNNLLAAMLGHSELMLGRLEAGHPLRRNAEEVQKAASRGAMLTRQLLSFGRKDVIVPKVIDMNAVVAGMEGMLRRLIGEDIEYESVGSPREAPVRADRGQLEQVILNLVVNARDAMPQGGQLTVEVGEAQLDEAYVASHPAARVGRHVVLAVTDTGCGMDAETLAHVFEPFFTTKERGKGTGLGLATVYGIVEQSGGQVLAYSEAGVGSSFKVYLPFVAEAVEAETEARPVVAAPRGGTETILVVEDEDAVRATAVEALETSGYTVLQGRDGVEALALAGAHRGEIHLLVSDVVMPRMGGGELAQRLAAQRPNLRVLFISGYPDDAVVRHGVVERGAPLLQKPFALSDFVRRVRDVLDAPRRKAA